MLHYLLQLKLPGQEQSYQDNLKMGLPMAADNLNNSIITSFIIHNLNFNFRCLVLNYD